MSSLINIASSPKCIIELLDKKGYFNNHDEIKGTIVISTPCDGQILHYDGIKVSLIGIIGKSILLLYIIIISSIETKSNSMFGYSDNY